MAVRRASRVALDAALAALVGPVEREVGGPQQLIGAGSVLGHDHADAGAEDDPFAVEVQGRPEGVAQTAGHLDGGLLTGHVLEQHGELVAAEASRRVGLPHAGHDARGGGHEGAVADQVTEAVVDGLEVVEVDHQQADALLAPGQAAEGVLQPVPEEGPVGQPRQRVVEGPEGELVLAALEVGGHGIEGGGQVAELVVPLEAHAVGEVAGAQPDGAGAQQAHGPEHRRRQPAGGQHRHPEAGETDGGQEDERELLGVAGLEELVLPPAQGVRLGVVEGGHGAHHVPVEAGEAPQADGGAGLDRHGQEAAELFVGASNEDSARPRRTASSRSRRPSWLRTSSKPERVRAAASS
jgi:hypothetical protein